MITGFAIGDEVEVLDDTVVGIISKIDNDVITIETTDGFHLDYTSAELMPISKKDIRKRGE